jgi:DNA modification methylase
LCLQSDDINDIRSSIRDLHRELSSLATVPCYRDDLSPGVFFSSDEIDAAGSNIIYPKLTILDELKQMTDARTISRSKYYIQRFLRGISSVRTNGVNDINLNRWKEYDDVLTDSLWIINHRDRTGVHNAEYWGNFIPQIPYQMLLRYTKVGDWVLDPFAGSGTTLIECRYLGRNGVGIELIPDVAETSMQRLNNEKNRNDVQTRIVIGDSTQIDYQELIKEMGIDVVQLLIMHPPYHDIIRFSDDDRDLSNKPTVDEFILSFGQVVDRTYEILEKGRYLIVVIGDKYESGEWIPLGFYTMQAVIERGYSLKSIVIKNYDQTKGKRDQTQLWRYRALVGGFYIFKHEYIYIFQK